MGYDSCFTGHPAYWDGGYCKWDAYYNWVEQGNCECTEEEVGDTRWLSGTTSQSSCYSACTGIFMGGVYYAVYHSTGYYEGAWVWSDYCVYHENTCRGGYA